MLQKTFNRSEYNGYLSPAIKQKNNNLPKSVFMSSNSSHTSVYLQFLGILYGGTKWTSTHARGQSTSFFFAALSLSQPSFSSEETIVLLQ